jgi:hypothetical protein
VHHPVTDTVQSPGQSIKAQPGIGRNEIKVKLNGFHGMFPGLGACEIAALR